MTVHAGLATLPERWIAARVVIASILPQVTRLDVSLNGHKRVPKDAPKAPHVHYHLKEGPQSCETKLFPSNADYYLSIDDDLIPPAGYVDDFMRWAVLTNGHYALTHHGTNVKLLHREKRLKRIPVAQCRFEVKDWSFVEIPGTGVTFYPGDLYADILRDMPETKNMSDVAVGKALKDMGRRAIALPHSNRYLKYVAPPKGTTIYDTYTRTKEWEKDAYQIWTK